ncbi:isoprenylcysteine carboxylmethyltransferase family protein [Ginsengibacter hankyongi]|uniref:Isoprenylcysteine carboxylmethyltransferase family protein n=1 Tax=Ginsengibacter hankyongi TaxID=2607284 RepID=A0A5J5ILT9_9BACT|nr:isoprenylcysteine carboxylmethyltransferase family protein [Ginsengibacter hankyongi]
MSWLAILIKIEIYVSFQQKNLSYNYLVLALSWIAYFILHSVLASTKVKIYVKQVSTKFYRYYRLIYTLFATISLIFILWFQYSFKSPLLLNSLMLKYISFLLLVIPGFAIMFVSIFKYFKLLSGIRSIYLATPPAELKLNGIHKYVRHPLYLGTLLFVWGLFFIFPFLNNLIAVVAITMYVLVGIKFEEKKLVKEFGKDYTEYMKKVPGLIPKL